MSVILHSRKRSIYTRPLFSTAHLRTEKRKDTCSNCPALRKHNIDVINIQKMAGKMKPSGHETWRNLTR